MIKFTAGGKGGRTLVGLGITEKNVERLKLGHPIHIMGIEMGLPFDITIFYGKDEQTIAADLRRAGLIDPEKTILHDTSQKPRTRQ